MFSPTTFTGQLTCKNGTVYPTFLHQASRLTVPQGCEIKLKSHIIFSDILFDTSPPPLQYAWHWDPKEMPSHLLEGATHLDQQIQALRTHLYQTHKNFTNTKPDFTSLLANEISSPSTFSFWFWPLFVLFIAVLACLGLWCFCLRRRQQHQRRARRRHRVDSPGQKMIVLQPNAIYPPLPDDSSEDEISRIARTSK